MVGTLKWSEPYASTKPLPTMSLNALSSLAEQRSPKPRVRSSILRGYATPAMSELSMGVTHNRGTVR